MIEARVPIRRAAHTPIARCCPKNTRYSRPSAMSAPQPVDPSQDQSALARCRASIIASMVGGPLGALPSRMRGARAASAGPANQAMARICSYA